MAVLSQQEEEVKLDPNFWTHIFFLPVVAGVAGDGNFGHKMKQTNSKISLNGHFLFELLTFFQVSHFF